ncbi:MAG TPA: glycosyltransferase family 4 protein [Patescibacteria group bacterium]|nr:glycosyltransferase family 4 protein [Patescibacteria group bacterium]
MQTLIVTKHYPPEVNSKSIFLHNLAHHLSGDVVVLAPLLEKKAENAAEDEKLKRVNFQSFILPDQCKIYGELKRALKGSKPERIIAYPPLVVGEAVRKYAKKYRVPYWLLISAESFHEKALKEIKRLRVLCQEAEKVIVTSNSLKNKLKQVVEVLETKITIVYPAPNEMFFTKANPEAIATLRNQLALQGKKVMITVANMEEGKGYPHLIRLLPDVVKKVPNLVWLIVGDGPKKKLLVDLIVKNDLQNVARFLGTIPQNELPKYMQLADLFVLLTHKDQEVEEANKAVFLEAAATGLPVVAGQAPGVDEVVKNLETGLIVDAYQDMSVISAISDLLRESEYAKKMGEAGRQMVFNEFSWEKMAIILKQAKNLP